MPALTITYEEARKNYPEAAGEVLAAKKKSRAKTASAAPEELEWRLSWSVRVPGYTFAEVLAGAVDPKDEDPEEVSIEDAVNEEMSRVSATLEAKKGRGRWTSEPLQGEVKEIRECIRRKIEEERARKEEIEAMTPEERSGQVEGALKKLRKDPGFIEMRGSREGLQPEEEATETTERAFRMIARGHALVILDGREEGAPAQAYLSVNYAPPMIVRGIEVPDGFGQLPRAELERMADQVIEQARSEWRNEAAEELEKSLEREPRRPSEEGPRKEVAGSHPPSL